MLVVVAVVALGLCLAVGLPRFVRALHEARDEFAKLASHTGTYE